MYGVDPSGWPAWKRRMWEDCIPHIEAKRRVDAGDLPEDIADLEQLLLLATGDAAEAKRIKWQVYQRRLERKTIGK